MPTIVAGHFQLQDQIEQARSALIGAGFPAPHISAFYVNQPGQHDLYRSADEHVAAEPRKAGMLIAVSYTLVSERERALSVLRQLGADHLEQAEGRIEEGNWSDFDPLATPVLIR